MKKQHLKATLFLIILLLTAFGGLYLGQTLLHLNQQTTTSNTNNWHQRLHQNLDLSIEQHKKLDVIESKFNSRQKELEKNIKQANRKLAQAFRTEKKYGASVVDATNQIHHHMGDLQKATLEHLFEMRSILTEEQNKKLDQMVSDALQ